MDRPEVDLDDLYRDVVMDHYRSPRGRQELDRADLSNSGQNPLCGDEVHLDVKLDGGKVAKVRADSHGCAISVASGSMMAELLEGRTETEARQLAEAFRLMMHGQPLPPNIDLGDLKALEGVKKFPVRIKCALLPWTTLTDALDAHEHGQAPAVPTTTEGSADPIAPPGEPMPTKEQVMDALRAVEDPEIALNIVDLGLIYGIEFDESERLVKVKMTLTTPYCPYGPELVAQAKGAITSLDGVKFADVQLVWEPLWDPKTMAADHVKDRLGLW
ncbi:MAG: Fe-S cluster assembly sulfur transfer protein SufU [Candidatus Coatesbacteria bacterium]